MKPKNGGARIDWVLAYAALGWRCFPVHEMTAEGVCSCAAGGACDRPGKHPRTASGLKEATTIRNELELWWSRWPGASIGIATGKESALTVVDADCSKGKPGVMNLTELCAAQGGVPATMIVNTGSGGLHLYFAYTDRLKTGSDVLAEAIDVRNDGGFVIAPPSNHASGGAYAWRNEAETLLAVPEWLLGARQSKGKKTGRGRPRVHAAEKIDRVESMLAAIDPDDRDRWLAVGCVLGRLYIGTPLENDAWALYEAWSARSAKFDENRTGNMQRMQEAFRETSQAEGRGAQLSIGSLIHWAREGGWRPFGDRQVIRYEPGSESIMAEALAEALIAAPGNRFFNVMGEVMDVLKTQVPIVRLIQSANEAGRAIPETLVVRPTKLASLLDAASRVAVLEATDKTGNPRAVPIPGTLGTMVLGHHAPRFPALAGIAEWPLVGADGSLITREHGYDEATGLFFDIDPAVKLDEGMSAEAGWAFLRDELLVDFPFEEEIHRAAALGMLLSFMQRPLMKTCPGFASTAPQALSGKSTLIELASIAVHGIPIASHAFSGDDEELRKAIHSLLLAKFPAVLFDNLKRGSSIDSDVLAKLLTSETATDRTLGASETRKQVNSLLVAFTGNNIAFTRDLSSRIITIRLNAKIANPLARKFAHTDVRAWAGAQRNRVLSALVAILRAGIGVQVAGGQSRFEDFDRLIVGAVHQATGLDVRLLLAETPDEDAEAEDGALAALKLMRRWQQHWRKENNGSGWRAGELSAAIEAKTFDDSGIAIFRTWADDPKKWEIDLPKCIAYALRNLNGDHRHSPFLLSMEFDRHTKTNKWIVVGPDETAPSGPVEAF